jgi:hypothetical protein
MLVLSQQRQWLYTADLIHGGRFKPAFAKRDKKQTMIDPQRILSDWFKNQFCPYIRLSRLRSQGVSDASDQKSVRSIGNFSNKKCATFRWS